MKFKIVGYNGGYRVFERVWIFWRDAFQIMSHGEGAVPTFWTKEAAEAEVVKSFIGETDCFEFIYE